jgi:GH24 family phage-related lysozyme (muramidase)
MSVSDAAGAVLCAKCLVELFEDGEKFRARPYRDQGGVWTIGTGLTRINGQRVGPTTAAITPAEDNANVEADIAHWLDVVERLITVELSAIQAAALVSLAYNCGQAPLLSDGNVGLALNRGEYLSAADAFRAWNRVHGVVADGLVVRREVERLVFLGVLDPLDRSALLAAQQQSYRAVKGAEALEQLVHGAAATPTPTRAVTSGLSSSEPTADELMNIYNPGV